MPTAVHLASVGPRAVRSQSHLSALQRVRLTVRKRKVRRRAVGQRAPSLIEVTVNARWSLDFDHHQFSDLMWWAALPYVTFDSHSLAHCDAGSGSRPPHQVNTSKLLIILRPSPEVRPRQVTRAAGAQMLLYNSKVRSRAI